MYLLFDVETEQPISVYKNEKDVMIIRQLSNYKYDYRPIPYNLPFETRKCCNGYASLVNGELKITGDYTIYNSDYMKPPVTYITPPNQNGLYYFSIDEIASKFGPGIDPFKYFEIKLNALWRNGNV